MKRYDENFKREVVKRFMARGNKQTLYKWKGELVARRRINEKIIDFTHDPISLTWISHW